MCSLFSAAGSPDDSVKPVEELAEGCSILIEERELQGLKARASFL